MSLHSEEKWGAAFSPWGIHGEKIPPNQHLCWSKTYWFRYFCLRYRASIFKILLRKLSQGVPLRLLSLYVLLRSAVPPTSAQFPPKILLAPPLCTPDDHVPFTLPEADGTFLWELQANFHSCFPPVFPLQILLSVALCLPLLYVSFN